MISVNLWLTGRNPPSYEIPTIGGIVDTPFFFLWMILITAGPATSDLLGTGPDTYIAANDVPRGT